jgi:hypothetical protein
MSWNLISADLGTKKIYKHVNFTTTIDQQITAPWSGSPVGATYDLAGNLISAVYSTSTISRHSGFSSTIIESFSISGVVGNRLRGISIDQNGNIIACIRFTDSKINRYVGFSSTVDVSLSAPTTEPHGATWDGADLYYGDPVAGAGGIAKMHKMLGFSTTIQSSFDVGGTNARYDISYDGVNLLNQDIGTDDLIQLTGFSSTPLSTINSPNSLPYGLTIDNADERMSAAVGEAKRRFSNRFNSGFNMVA